MSLTPEQEKAIYGCTVSELRVVLENSVVSLDVLAVTFLTDAAEALKLHDYDTARQRINRVRYVIVNHLVTSGRNKDKVESDCFINRKKELHRHGIKRKETPHRRRGA